MGYIDNFHDPVDQSQPYGRQKQPSSVIDTVYKYNQKLVHKLTVDYK
jgi:hypothetical protein